MLDKYWLNLHLFDGNTNVTTDVGLTDEMKTYYSTYLIRLAEPLLIHDQFGQKHPIPKAGGKTIEFRKYDSLPKALTPLTEGVTPDGQKLTMSTITASVKQYGGYVELSDILILTAIDNNLMEATRVIAEQAARTLDTITREVLNGGTNVQYGHGNKDFRSELTGGETNPEDNDYFDTECITRAVRFLKVMNTRKINGDFVGIIHPDIAYDIMVNDKQWHDVKTYSDPKDIYEGEIGKIQNVRFVETTEAKVFHADDLVAATADEEAKRNLTVLTASGDNTITISGTLTDAQAAALAGRKVIIGDEVYEIESATAPSTIKLTTAPTTSPSANTVIYPGEAGKNGRDVYSTLILGADAYGVTEIEGGGLQHIVKQLGSAGTADPLNQRATCGWKATKCAERLVEQYMIRCETCSTFEIGAN